jgi:geranylgeranyl pyrophosphate synthase
MTPPSNINQKVQGILLKYGKKGLETAKKTLNDTKFPPPIQEILSYFIEETWPNTHHPALIALCCQAVNGNPELTHNLSAAIVLLTGAADMHDDIIDGSKYKSQKQTALGRYNKDLVLLAGDALLFRGMLLLHQACEEFSPKKQKAVFDCVEQSFFKIGNAISSERSLREKPPVDIVAYRKVIESKGGVAQACAEIGAIIGDANPQELNILRHYGKTLGVLMSLKNEFTDLQDHNELENRLKNEILPLPLLYAFEDAPAMKRIMALLQGKLTKQKAMKITELVMRTEQVQKLKKEMCNMALAEEKNLEPIKINVDAFKLLLQSSLEGTN